LHGTEYKINQLRRVSVCAHEIWGPNISKTTRDRGSIPMGHQ